MLTLDKLKKLPLGKVFATGVLPNSEEGIYMTNSGGELRWVAKKGWGNSDWAVYCHWSDKSVEYIADHGDKVRGKEYIQRCVPCTEEVMQRYRY